MRQDRDRVRAVVLELWEKIRIDWGFATDRIADAFRRHRSLTSRERRDVSEILYGMIRQSRRIDFALEHGGARLKGSRRELARYAAYRLLEGDLSPEQARGIIADVDWDAVARIGQVIERERDEVLRLALTHSLPDWLARRFVKEFEGEADALAASLNQRAPLTLRANRLRTTREELIARLRSDQVECRPARFAPDAIVLETRLNVFSLDAFRQGLFEVQDEASQLVCELVAPPPRGLVVDACAGAGGKTLGIGALLGNKGRIVSLDVDGRKLEELRRRARRAGLSNARAIEVDGESWPDEVESLRGRADRVLVDVPCSGIGALRRNPEARWRLTETDLGRLPRQQEAIARRAMELVSPGGRLVYSTCTILRDENEAVIERLLSVSSDFQLMRAAEIWSKDRASPITDPSGTFLKMLPNRHDTDGFFGAVLRRKA